MKMEMKIFHSAPVQMKTDENFSSIFIYFHLTNIRSSFDHNELRD
jgi:hypothetical protein